MPSVASTGSWLGRRHQGRGHDGGVHGGSDLVDERSNLLGRPAHSIGELANFLTYHREATTGFTGAGTGVLTAPMAVIPEPATVAVLGLAGIAGLLETIQKLRHIIYYRTRAAAALSNASRKRWRPYPEEPYGESREIHENQKVGAGTAGRPEYKTTRRAHATAFPLGFRRISGFYGAPGSVRGMYAVEIGVYTRRIL